MAQKLLRSAEKATRFHTFGKDGWILGPDSQTASASKEAPGSEQQRAQCSNTTQEMRPAEQGQTPPIYY